MSRLLVSSVPHNLLSYHQNIATTISCAQVLMTFLVMLAAAKHRPLQHHHMRTVDATALGTGERRLLGDLFQELVCPTRERVQGGNRDLLWKIIHEAVRARAAGLGATCTYAWRREEEGGRDAGGIVDISAAALAPTYDGFLCRLSHPSTHRRLPTQRPIQSPASSSGGSTRRCPCMAFGWSMTRRFRGH